MDYFEDLANKYCDRFKRELEEKYHQIENSKQISPSDLEIIDTLFHCIKSIKTVLAMDESTNRYSGRYYPMYSGGDYSGRGRDSMGRYTRDNDKASMMGMLEDKMRSVRTEDEAMAINDAMAAISRLR